MQFGAIKYIRQQIQNKQKKNNKEKSKYKIYMRINYDARIVDMKRK